MSSLFEELDYRPTEIGELSLRRRRDLYTGNDIYEIKLGEEYLMSSRFTDSEVALGRLGVAEHPGSELDIVVGGLGLGCTAAAVLESQRVHSVLVVEVLQPVIDWHRRAILPHGKELSSDPRCRFVAGDFFAMALSPDGGGFDPQQPDRTFDVVLLDIDHSPSIHLDSHNAALYQLDGLQQLSTHLKPGGVFGLWSNDPPDSAFTEKLKQVFPTARAEEIAFHNPLQNREAVQTVYLAG